jgi:tetratricopeptide (TPR) repeat protein
LALELLSREWVAHGDDSLIGSLDALNALPAPALSLPQAVKVVYERQTQQLDDRTRAVLDLAAVLSRRMSDLRFYKIIGCTEGEAVSRLTQLLEMRLLREVGGQIEFRNELVRAHAYYEVPSTLRLELHRRVARLLEQGGDKGERQPELEIAWHYIIGQDNDRATRFALAGAERSIGEGAPREAELILRALRRKPLDRPVSRQSALLLSAALMAQSKAEESVPLLDELLSDNLLSKHDIARTVHLYASAMYLLNRDSTAHSEMAERALQIARECGDMELLARALFEYARAGVESGRVEMTEACRDEIHRTLLSSANGVPPIALFADAYCSYHLLDIQQALKSAEGAVHGLTTKKDIGELALGYNALGNCHVACCRFEEARRAYSTALGLWGKVGDDYRRALTSYNLGSAYLAEGQFENGICAIEASLSVGAWAPDRPVMAWAWSSLALAHMVLGNRREAIQYFDAMKKWMQSGRSWAMSMEYYSAAAEIELAMGNEEEALKYVAKAEQELQGRRSPFISQGTLERLRVLAAFHTQGPEAAKMLAVQFGDRYRGRHAFAYLESVAAMAWFEWKTTGSRSPSTEADLRLFEEYRAVGKQAILKAQGFL